MSTFPPTPERIPVEVVNRSGLDLPLQATSGSAGYDLVSASGEIISLAPMERKLIPTGLYIALPQGYEAQIRPRSGLAYKYGVTVLNAPGTVDADYRGEVKVLLVNLSRETFSVEYGMRIAQLVIKPSFQIIWQPVENLPPSSRGSGGFGHSGLKD